MLENWCYESEVLKQISGHYKDLSKPLPDDLRVKLINAKNVTEALKNRRQLLFGTFDMLVHTAGNYTVLWLTCDMSIVEGKVDTATLWAKCCEEIALTPAQPGTNGAAGFG